MNKIIYTKNAPEPIGPYSQAIKSDSMLFLSGQIPINPKTGIIESNNIEDQTQQIFKNISEILKEGNSSFSDVVKTTIFIDNMNNFQHVNEVYGKYFKDESAPARETVAVKTLPKSVRIEISMVAVV